MSLVIHNLHARVAGGQEILRGLNLEVPKGSVHAIMGPNGSGKSTLSKVISGHPDYEVTSGEVLLDGVDVLAMEPDARAPRLKDGEELDAVDYYGDLYKEMDKLEIPRNFTSRSVNEGFSGGEKKRNEVLQMAMLKPAYAILDETDSGLDIDALKVVAAGVNALRSPSVGMLVITHYQRLLDYIAPDVVHVLVGGRIVRSAGPELAYELESKGYDWIKETLTEDTHAVELASV
ncbi:MAG: ATP-binding cassette domain-containing protein [Proteobacteria bacterium]|nr:ATP-binding cassette domain-containing protein [Pseudomonadota bacterium]